MDEYYPALGRFIHMFGRAEYDLRATIANFITTRIRAIDPKDYVVIKELTRRYTFSQARETLLRLMKVTKADPDTIEEVKAILQQFADIAEVRHKVVHISATPDDSNTEGWFSVIDLLSVQIEEIEQLKFRHESLLAMAHDLEFIPLRLAQVFIPEIRVIYKRDPKMSASVNGPWRFSAKSDLRREGPKAQRRQAFAKPAKGRGR
jgi:hypothetical protein